MSFTGKNNQARALRRRPELVCRNVLLLTLQRHSHLACNFRLDNGDSSNRPTLGAAALVAVV